MKNSFSIFELLLTLVVSSIIIVYSTIFIKELYFTNEELHKIEIYKLDLLSTKIYLEKKKNIINKLKFSDNTLFSENSILLKGVDKFSIKQSNNKIKVHISYQDKIHQEWIFKL